MLRDRPAFLFALPFLLGIMLGWHWSFSPLYILAFAALLLVIAALIAVWIRPFAPQTVLLLLLPLACLAGILKITLDKELDGRDQIERFLGSSEPVKMECTVSDPPTWRGERLQFVVKGREIASASEKASILVTVDGEASVLAKWVDSLQYGRDLEIEGVLVQPGTARNPGEFDLRAYLHVQGIYARCFVETVDRIRITGESGNRLLTDIIYPLRRSIARTLDSEIGGEEAKLLKGLVIGDRSEITYEVKTSFVNSGVMHVLAVSGLHVVLILLILEALFSALHLPEKPRTVLICILLVGYMFLTGSSPSVVRAVIMGIVVLGARLFERRVDVVNSLAVAAIVILFFDARQLFLPGFQLSFVAVFAIVFLYPRLLALTSRLPETLRRLPGVDSVLRLVALSVAAGIGTLPFTALYFGKIPVVGFLANVLIVPLSSIVLALGMTTVLFYFISTALGSVYAEVTRVSTALMLDSVDWFGNLPFSYIEAFFNSWHVVAAYIVIALAFGIRRLKQAVLVCLILLNMLLYGCVLGMIGSPRLLRVTVLDVGQGDAILVEFPDNRRLLVDAGPRTFGTDAGARFIAPFLRFRGITRLDALLVSHPHSDHLGGAPFVLRTFPVREVIGSGSASASVLFAEYAALIDSLHLPARIVKAGDRIDGFSDARLYVLHPTPSFINSNESDLNNQSVVIRLAYGSTSILLAGDVEEEGERQIVDTYDGFLRSDVLKAGHHGSSTSSSEGFLERVDPTLTAVSVGRGNKFRHPSPEVLRRLREGGSGVYRTDEHNAVVLVSDGKRWTVENWR